MSKRESAQRRRHREQFRGEFDLGKLHFKERVWTASEVILQLIRAVPYGTEGLDVKFGVDASGKIYFEARAKTK